MPLFDFKLAISEHVCKSGKAKKRPTSAASTPTSKEGTPTTCRKRPRQDFPLASVRTDCVGHFPIWKMNRQLCLNDCAFRSYTFCEKCNIFYATTIK